MTVTDSSEHAVDLLRSHATSAGRPRSRRRIRATLGVRLAQLSDGGSGVSARALPGLAEMLNHDNLPGIRDYGSIGTGDLPALAAVALALCGEGTLEHPLSPRLSVSAYGPISMMNSNAATLADAAGHVRGGGVQDRLRVILVKVMR